MQCQQVYQLLMEFGSFSLYFRKFQVTNIQSKKIISSIIIQEKLMNLKVNMKLFLKDNKLLFMMKI